MRPSVSKVSVKYTSETIPQIRSPGRRALGEKGLDAVSLALRHTGTVFVLTI